MQAAPGVPVKWPGAAFRPAAHPLRTPAVAATGERGGGIGRLAQAARRRPGEVAPASVPWWITTTRKSYATHRPAPRRSWMRRSRYASPSARRRSRRRTTGGGHRSCPRASGIWRRAGVPVKWPRADVPGITAQCCALHRATRHKPWMRRPPRIPIRPPAAAATHRGRRAPGISPGTPAPRVCRHRAASASSENTRFLREVKILRFDGHLTSAEHALVDSDAGVGPPRIPTRAGGRGDGPRAAGARTGDWHRGARSALFSNLGF